MGIFKPAYRLSFRTFPSWLLDHFQDIYYGIRNIVRWTPVIWFDADFDWCYLAEIMEYKLRRMSKVFETGHHLHRERDAHQTLICAALLRRLMDEPYFDNADARFATDGRPKHRNRAWADHIRMQNEQDMALFLKTFRHLRNWWD